MAGESEEASETLFALSSGLGRSGVAVVRLSGGQSGAVLKQVAGALPEARRASLRALRDPRSGELLDRALVLWFPAPQSFTGEDMAEFQVHGGPAVLGALLEVLAAQPGLRPAEPGELTRRAFEGGRLDLAEVEGLADLLAAETAAQRRLALRQFGGGLSHAIEGWRARLLRALALLEAAIDFPEEDLPEDLVSQVTCLLRPVAAEIAAALADSGVGERLREGLSIAILGAPNAGKSSLLNTLARRDVAIVAASAGTTRDTLEVALDLGGFPATLVDTAGLRQAAAGQDLDPVELEGMRRARVRAAAADIKLVLFDGTDWPNLDREGLDLLDGRSLAVLTKSDLCAEAWPAEVGGEEALAVSSKTGAGMAALVERLTARAWEALQGGETSALVTRARHRHALETAAAALARVPQAPEVALAAEELRAALAALGRVVGRVDVEDLLDVIFREFCIGK